MRDFVKTIIRMLAFNGLYNVLMRTWQFAEEAELGYTIITKADTAICLGISFLIFIVLIILDEV